MLHIPWDLEEIELNRDELEAKVRAYSAVADMSPEEFRRLIDGPTIPPRTGYLQQTIGLHIPRPVHDISQVPYATYPPVQLSFDFYRDWRMYRP